MPRDYIEIENVAAAETMVQIVSSLPGQEAHGLLRTCRDQGTEARTETVLKELRALPRHSLL